MKINWTEFWSLLKAAKNADIVSFYSSVVITDSECNFGEMRNCKIKVLDLYRVGEFSLWYKFPMRIMNIITGVIGSSNFAQSIERLDLEAKNLDSKLSSTILKKKINDLFISEHFKTIEIIL